MKQKIKTMNKLLFLNGLLFLLLLFFAGLPDHGIAQQITPTVTCSGGETFTNSTLSLDFSIGEIITETLSATGLLLTQGFIQCPDRNTGIDEKTMDEKDMIVYPNPATDRIYLLYKNTETNPVKIHVKDLQGRIILRLNFDTNPMAVNLNTLNPGFYTVAILFDNRQTINKKIVKQ